MSDGLGTVITESLHAGSVLETAFDSAPVGVGVCDEDGRFLAVNPGLARLLRTRRQEMLGRPFLAYVHPDERAASLACYFSSVVAAAADRARKGETREMRCLTGDGSIVWVSVSWSVTPPDESGDQFGIVHLTDITDRKRVEEALAEVQRRVELAFTSSPIGIGMVDVTGRIAQSNPRLAEILGYTCAELEDMHFLDVTHPDDAAPAAGLFAQMLDGTVDTHDMVKRYVRSDGELIFVRQVSVAVRGADGSLDYVMVQLEDVTGERTARALLREHAMRDGLTKLATRELLDYELSVSTSPRSLVVVELDEVSRLNGALGPSGGDKVLIEVAERLAATCRTSELAARLGGGTFALLIDDADGQAATAVAERVTETLARPMVIEGIALKVSAYVGVAADPDGAEPAEALLRRAQLALHASKTRGLHTPTAFVPDMLAASERALLIESGLLTSFESGAAHLAYQPIVDPVDGSIVMVEALARWTHDVLGPLNPGEFVAIAERCGLIGALTEWTLRTACADAAGWRADPSVAGEPVVAVNISPTALGDAGFPELVERCLAEAGIPASSLVLEVIESAVLDAGDAAWANAERLAAAGVRFAVDDFGAGYSSLSRLACLPVSHLKLDKSFVARAGEPDGAAIIRASVAVAAELGLELVAEGVENVEQFDLLNRAGCPLVQGFLIATPQGADEVRVLLEQGRLEVTGE